MKKLKFVCQNDRQKQFAIQVRKNVNHYFEENGISMKSNFGMVLKTVIMLSFYIIPFVFIMTIHTSIWVALLLVILMGIGAAGIGMNVMHDAVHGAFSKSDRWNKILGGTMYLLGGNVYNWKIQHNVFHHAYTNIDGVDEDIASKGPIRLSEHARLRKIQRYQYIYAFFFYGLMTISKLVMDFIQLFRYNKSGLTRKYQINPTMEYIRMVGIKIIYLFIFVGLPIIYTDFKWWQVVLGFFIMHLVVGGILSTIFQMAHVVEGAEQPMPDVDGVVACEWAVHELHTTSDFARDNLFLNWYVGGLNFQIEHHLFPNICHVHYRKISPIVEQTAKQFGFEYNLKPSFSNAFASHVMRLKDLGRTQAK